MSYGKRTLAAIGQRLNTPSRRLAGRNLVLALSPLGAGRHPGPPRVANGGGWRHGRKSRYESEREGRWSTARGHGILNRYSGFQAEAEELKWPSRPAQLKWYRRFH